MPASVTLSTYEFADHLALGGFGQLSFNLAQAFVRHLEETLGAETDGVFALDVIALRCEYTCYTAAALVQDYGMEITLPSLAADGIETEGYDSAMACMTDQMGLNAIVVYLQAYGSLSHDAVVCLDDEQVIIHNE